MSMHPLPAITCPGEVSTPHRVLPLLLFIKQEPQALRGLAVTSRPPLPLADHALATLPCPPVP